MNFLLSSNIYLLAPDLPNDLCLYNRVRRADLGPRGNVGDLRRLQRGRIEDWRHLVFEVAILLDNNELGHDTPEVSGGVEGLISRDLHVQ